MTRCLYMAGDGMADFISTGSAFGVFLTIHLNNRIIRREVKL